MKKIAAFLVLGVSGLATAGAEEPPVFLGSRVRIVTAQGILTGNVLAWEGEQVSLLNTGLGDRAVIRTDAIQRLEVSRGRKRPWLKSTLVGTAMGGAIGALMPVENPCPEGVQPGPTCETKAYLVQGGALTGAVIGLIAGATRQVDRWEPVPFSRFRISVTPVPKGAQASVTFLP